MLFLAKGKVITGCGITGCIFESMIFEFINKGGITGFLRSLMIAFVKKEDWETLKILNVKTEDFKNT